MIKIWLFQKYLTKFERIKKLFFMKKHLLIASLLAIPFLGNSQVFQENFDGAGPGIGAWTLIDVDGKAHAEAVADFDASAWVRKDRGGATPNYGGPDNDYAACSSSWYDPAGTSNDWLISPSIALPAAATMLKWDAKAQDPDFRDGYKVMLSPNGGNTVADFTVTLFTVASENSTWTTRTVSLAPYVGTNARIAFVNNSTDMFVLLVDNISITAAPTVVPNCATQLSPANAATGISYLTPVPLTWSAPTSGEAPSSYDVFLGTAPNPTTLLGNVTGTSTTAPGLLASTMYYWKVISKNAAGSATGCSEFTFTTAANPVAPYCGPLVYSSGVEPITSVVFGGMTNTSPAATGGSAHEIFLDKVAQVNQGGTFEIKLKGNTDGATFTTKFIVFVDWNQDGDFLDAGETYFDTAATTIQVTGSTGTDAKEAVGNIAVPANAVLGNTRMRIKKNFGASTFYPNPCTSAGTLAAGANTGFGQAEDYTVNVGPNMAVSEISKAGIKAYPNPVKDVFNIAAEGKIKSVKVFDIAGKQLLTKDLNEVKSQIDFSKLTSGVYVVTIVLEDGTISSTKVIKE